MAVVTMRSRVRYGIAGGSREMSIRFFGYFVGRRYLCFLYLELSVPNIFPALPVLSHLSPAFRPVPLDPRHGPRRISHITFRSLHLFHLFLLLLPPLPLPPAPSLLSRPGSFVPNASTLARNRV